MVRPRGKSEPVGCLAGFLASLLGGGGRESSARETLPYRRKDYLLSKAERSFYEVLRVAVSEQYHVFPKVRLADLLFIPGGTTQWQRHFNRIQSKHVDFVLCDRQYLRPLLVIELDDASHAAPDRAVRDEFVDRALAAGGLSILHVPAQRGYNARTLADQIRTLLAPPRPVPAGRPDR